MSDNKILNIVSQLSLQLIKRNKIIATAESCTGGFIAKSLTDIDGSSQWFECSVVSYSNQSKIDLLGVQQHTLDQYGAISQAIVKEMVLGLLDRCNANIGISISGIAGPGGGTKEKPVGCVWIAWATPGVFIEAIKCQFSGDREAVREQAVIEALKGVERILLE